MKKDFLFEIGTEELPAKQLAPLKNSLKEMLQQALDKACLTYSGEVISFATPRRLAVLVTALQTHQADQIVERKGPNVQNAFDSNGKPTKACEGFARSCQMQIADLEQRDTPQGRFLFAKQLIKGKSTQELLPQMIQDVLDKLPIAKPMHWGSYAESFLRPVRWVLMLLGEEVIAANFFGLPSQNTTLGHRFVAKKALLIPAANQYEKILKSNGKVIASFEQRKKIILRQLKKAAAEVQGQLCENPNLLDEVTGLVEWPQVLITTFDSRFLNVPKNALIASMESHQKSFAVKDTQGALLPYALVVSNLVSKDSKQVILGNERVLRARLSDAEFFYQKDLHIPLEAYRDDLKKVVFQAQLGSLYAKTTALSSSAKNIAAQLSFSEAPVVAASLIAKCDLRTQMVGEFPELQGEMGRVYALKQGQPKEVAEALFEQYLPRFSHDILPATHAGIALALADRFLNLVGIFGVGQIPSGEKDPFALRRAAIGICRIILEKRLRLPLRAILMSVLSAWQNAGANLTGTIDQVYDFIVERFRNIYLEQNIDANVLQAVVSLQLDDLLDMHERVHAINIFQALPEAASLAAAQKRVMNLFQKERLLLNALDHPELGLFELPEEHQLYDTLIKLKAEVQHDLSHKKYAAVLKKMALLKQPIDHFFDHVMVMVENEKLRHNRLCLLAQLSLFLNQVADISCL